MSDTPVLDDVVREFLIESHENLDRLDNDLLAFEKEPTSKPTLASIFRTLHTIKGTCGFLGFGNLETVAHAGETLLARLRDGEVAPRPEMFSALLALVDVVRHILSVIEATAQEPTEDNRDLVSLLSSLAAPSQASAVAAPAVSNPNPTGASAAASTEAPAAAPRPNSESSSTPAPGTPKAELFALPSWPATSPHGATGASAAPPRPSDLAGPLPAAPPSPAVSYPAGPMDFQAASTADGAAEARTPGLTESVVRIDVQVLDNLMNLVGELVLARNQTLQFANKSEDVAFQATTQRLSLITSELQEGIMKTRMQPISNILGKFPRVVRDLARSCKKQVRLEMDGIETELDRTILEAIKDPLTHLVRNAVDHGIEDPTKRSTLGKDPTGLIRLRAYHEGGQVILEITDDGRGIHPEVVIHKAIERGLLSREAATRLTDQEVIGLLFLPGFSTASAVTNVSGRGVGMDVVKTNIEKIGGTLELKSKPHAGMQLRIKIPLTLAIIPALIVTLGEERYAIPQVNLVELVRLDGDAARAAVEAIFSVRVYRLRGHLLPIVQLAHILGDDDNPPPSLRKDGAIHIAVVQADGRQFGLVVDDISDTQEIVVKPLAKQLKSLSLFAGATILGDGKVALILDVLGLGQRSGVVSPQRERTKHEVTPAHQDTGAVSEQLLLFALDESSRMAIPLSAVARLEDIPTNIIERAGRKDVVQYRGGIMPLLYVSDVFQSPDGPDGAAAPRTSSTPAAASLPVVVYAEPGRSFGLVVDRIVDIVDECISIQSAIHRSCVLGSAVVQGKVTEIVDVPALVRQLTSANPV